MRHFVYKCSCDGHNYTITITKHSKDRLKTSHFQFNHDFDWYQLPKAQCSVSLTIALNFHPDGCPQNSYFGLWQLFLSPGLPCKAQLSPAPIGRVCPGRLLVAPARLTLNPRTPAHCSRPMPTEGNNCPIRGQDVAFAKRGSIVR